jgi:hypothetical protein
MTAPDAIREVCNRLHPEPEDGCAYPTCLCTPQQIYAAHRRLWSLDTGSPLPADGGFGGRGLNAGTKST